ncbi:MAG: carboxypeptidase regulatory-like domain-containing protein [Bacteroidota bacterium]
MIFRLTTTLLTVLLAVSGYAQTGVISGSVRDADNDMPLSDAAVVVSGTGKFTATDAKGNFRLEGVPAGNQSVLVTHSGYFPKEIRWSVKAGANSQEITLQRDPAASITNINDLPTVTLEEADTETEGSGDVANLLNANRDIFQQVTGFGWGIFRFRERGYDSEHFPLFLNGVNINDPETGFAVFGEIGGLNDVLRNRESTVGLNPSEFTFSEIGGATRIDTRASNQRKQIRASYAISNRTYTNRMMLTASTGLMPGGWAVSFSGSRRWAQEGYFDGTFFDGYSYFLSVDKKINRKHALNLTFLGAPSIRGKVSDSFGEMFELAGTHRYNPSWGYQNGEKRNANIGHSNQPIGMLRYDWAPMAGTSVTASVYGQAGKRGDTRLDWFEASNPAPDYNRRLPSAILDSTLSAQWADALRNDEALRQINWTQFYDENSRNRFTVENAEGIAGNNVTGNRAQYIVADQRADSKELGFNIVLNQQLNSRSSLQSGVNYRWYKGQNFQVLDDLLGADYWLDINRFSSQDYPGQPLLEDNDANNPRNVIYEGDVFGYDYDENIRNGSIWVQAQTNLRKLSLFGAAEVGNNTFWRTGNMLNPRYPNDSYGDSQVNSFYTYGLKGGATYKLNGRNYLYANGFTGTKAPLFRDVYISPRQRNTVAPNTDVYGINSVEGGYLLRSPLVRARLTGYLTNFDNEFEARLYFSPTVGEFATLVMSGINRTHSGIEAAFEYKPVPQWVLSGAANLGYYRYTNRPTMTYTPDNKDYVSFENVTLYQDNFLVPRTPQTAATFNVKYEGRRFWFATLTFNWRDDFWFAYDPLRRRAEAVLALEPGSEIWNTIVEQEKAPAAYTVDLFAGKSWKIGDVFLYLNVGINNILDNKNVIVSGREAYRNAFGREPDDARLYISEVQYAPGLNYFISFSVRK